MLRPNAPQKARRRAPLRPPPTTLQHLRMLLCPEGGQIRVSKWAISRLFREFGAPQGAGPVGNIAGEYGNTRARRSSKPARPYIWRLMVLSRLI